MPVCDCTRLQYVQKAVFIFYRKMGNEFKDLLKNVQTQVEMQYMR